MKEYSAKILELNPDMTFLAEIYLGFGQKINKRLELQYNLQIIEDKKDKLVKLLNSLLNKDVVIKVHPDNLEKEEPIPVQIEYINDRDIRINLIFEMIALGYVNVYYNK